MKNPNAVALGRLGGLVGGPSRARSLSTDRRSAIAQQAAKIRWATNRRAARVKLAQQISNETGADVGILEHSLRLLEMDPLSRLAQGLKLGKIGQSVRVL